MATILGGDTLVITPTLALAGDKVAKILGREDLQNIHDSNHEQPEQGQGPMVQMQLDTQGQALRPDAGPFGDSLNKKPPNTLRIGMQNFGGFPLSPLDAKDESLRDFTTKYEFHILGIPENSACWHLLPTEARLQDRMSGWWEAVQLKSAY
jgi:hypothetical protein